MLIGIIGLNHKSAELALREIVSQVFQRRFDPLHSHHSSLSYILLSTCNRSEIYFTSDDLAEAHSYILAVLRQDIPIPFEHKVYSYFGHDCFYHLACVTAGMDSAIIGECEIQGQVKTAYEKATSFSLVAKELHFLFQKSLKLSKEIRTHFSRYGTMPTLEEAVFKMAKNQLGELSKQKILFVGLSEINYKIIKFFKKRETRALTLCNWHNDKAEKIANEESIAYLPWERLAIWSDFDLIIVGTRSPTYVLKPQFFSQGCKRRVCIDLSVPRNVDPKLSENGSIRLYNIDQINKSLNKKKQLQAAMLAHLERRHINRQVEQQIALFHARSLKLRMPHRAGEGDNVADIFHPGYKLHQSFKTCAKASMRDCAEAPQI